MGRWDSLRLEQVPMNLLCNAVRYSPNGGDVVVRVESVAHEARVSVEDHGIGIPREHQAKVFEPFFRSANAARARTSGAGLGQHISKEIIERHGGKMWFDSHEGQGSTFFFSLPQNFDSHSASTGT